MPARPDLQDRREELHPDLVRFLLPFNQGQLLKHPLCVQLEYSPEQNALINRTYRQIKAGVARAKEEKNWSSYVHLHERHARPNGSNLA